MRKCSQPCSCACSREPRNRFGWVPERRPERPRPAVQTLAEALRQESAHMPWWPRSCRPEALPGRPAKNSSTPVRHVLDEPVAVRLLADDDGAQTVGGGLKGCHVVNRQESVVVLTEGDAGALQFPLDERVAVDPLGGTKGKETGHADDARPQHLVPDVEVVAGEAATLVRQDAVVGVLRWDTSAH